MPTREATTTKGRPTQSNKKKAHHRRRRNLWWRSLCKPGLYGSPRCGPRAEHAPPGQGPQHKGVHGRRLWALSVQLGPPRAVLCTQRHHIRLGCRDLFVTQRLAWAATPATHERAAERTRGMRVARELRPPRTAVPQLTKRALCLTCPPVAARGSLVHSTRKRVRRYEYVRGMAGTHTHTFSLLAYVFHAWTQKWSSTAWAIAISRKGPGQGTYGMRSGRGTGARRLLAPCELGRNGARCVGAELAQQR